MLVFVLSVCAAKKILDVLENDFAYCVIFVFPGWWFWFCPQRQLRSWVLLEGSAAVWCTPVIWGDQHLWSVEVVSSLPWRWVDKWQGCPEVNAELLFAEALCWTFLGYVVFRVHPFCVFWHLFFFWVRFGDCFRYIFHIVRTSLFIFSWSYGCWVLTVTFDNMSVCGFQMSFQVWLCWILLLPVYIHTFSFFLGWIPVTW